MVTDVVLFYTAFITAAHIRFADSSVYRLLKKISEARRAKNRSFGCAQDGLGGGEHSEHVGARRLMVRQAHHERNDIHRRYSLTVHPEHRRRISAACRSFLDQLQAVAIWVAD